jgi:hypothetical protein
MSSTAAMPSAVNYLVSLETAVDAAGTGQVFELGPLAGKQVVIVLRITDIIEQEALDVSLWGSADGKDWGKEPLFAYPQAFYRGVMPAALDLRQKPDINFLQARWDVNRWGRGYPRPYFKFTLEIQDLGR